MNILSVFRLIYSLLGIPGGDFFNQPVLMESLESKTKSGAVVYNKIFLEEKENKHVWFMKQSHNGPHSREWDEIKIMVNFEGNSKKVTYHQIKDGKEVEYKASCLRCHSNGPRLIRANLNSKNAPLAIGDRMRIFRWNLLIKSYGEVETVSNNPFERKVPLIKNKEHQKVKLKISSCINCHRH